MQYECGTKITGMDLICATLVNIIIFKTLIEEPFHVNIKYHIMYMVQDSIKEKKLLSYSLVILKIKKSNPA